MQRPAPAPPAPSRDRARALPRAGTPQVVHLHRGAPPKPVAGAPCNGCGLCCAAAPCPLGMLLSRRRRGACAALAWVGDEARYRCGVVLQPRRWLPWLPAWAGRRLAQRWIGSSAGCDCTLEPA